MALDSNRITLCWPNLIERAQVSGGAWRENLPLALVQDSTLAVRCKSADADPASTWFDITLDKLRPVQCIAIASHTFSASATYRMRCYSDAEQTRMLWDSDWQAVWPHLFASSELEWEYDNFWLGTIDDDARALYTPLLTVFTGAVLLAQSVRVEIDDGGNPEGAVRIGRVFIGDAWQPTYNVSYGIQHGFDDATTHEEAVDRTEYADIKRQRRTVSFNLDWLSEEEAYQRIYSLQRVLGTHGEVIYAFDLYVRPESFARTFLARQQQLDALAQPYADTHTNGIHLLEIL